jgi:hypothetical protein
MWHYSSARVKVIWGTLSLFDQTDPDSGVQIVPDHDVWRHIDGVDGEVARVEYNSFPGRAVVNLSQHTPHNKNLVARLVADAQLGLVTAPFLLTNLEGGMSFSSPLSYLLGLPVHTYSSQAQFVSWTIMCPMLIPFPTPGQNAGVSR